MEDAVESYKQALALLRHIKTLGRMWARSNNPGRREAGREILVLLGGDR